GVTFPPGSAWEMPGTASCFLTRPLAYSRSRKSRGQAKWGKATHSCPAAYAFSHAGDPGFTSSQVTSGSASLSCIGCVLSIRRATLCRRCWDQLKTELFAAQHERNPALACIVRKFGAVPLGPAGCLDVLFGRRGDRRRRGSNDILLGRRATRFT